ncbi:hypothetical protein J2Z79_002391 [Symbiobacterium terraclitae]|uniref:SCP2 domain-containing protein n=1 Tax=Symbiobacterium terraclitae TaxID=557451 RepID=A0ABS4JVJ9_9FIRM|nr:hypothetical protein [Symbiobacterium terraclitae]MBP2018975.1 hypothetical protein [Symbiobacterium terraclitae]
MRGIKALLIRILLWFLGRGICACARLDSRVAAEVATWAEGASFCLAIAPAGPAMSLQLRAGRVRFLGLRPVADATLLITFKHLEGALPVFLGMKSIARAYAERRMTLRGDLTFAMSVVRVLHIAEAYLFPTLITRRIMQRVPRREVSMARVYLATLFAA